MGQIAYYTILSSCPYLKLILFWLKYYNIGIIANIIGNLADTIRVKSCASISPFMWMCKVFQGFSALALIV